MLHAGLRREGAAPEGAQRGAGKRALGTGPALLRRLTGERRVPCLTPLQGLTLPPLAPGAVPRRAAAPPGLEGAAGRAGRAAASLRLAGVGARGPSVRRWPGLAPRSRAEKEFRRLSGLASHRTFLAVVML